MTGRDSDCSGEAGETLAARPEGQLNGAEGNRPTSVGMTGDTNTGFAAAPSSNPVATAEVERLRDLCGRLEALRQRMDRENRGSWAEVAQEARDAIRTFSALTSPTDAAPVETETAKSDAMREALELAARRLESARKRALEDGDIVAAVGYGDWAKEARAALSGDPS